MEGKLLKVTVVASLGLEPEVIYQWWQSGCSWLPALQMGLVWPASHYLKKEEKKLPKLKKKKRCDISRINQCSQLLLTSGHLEPQFRKASMASMTRPVCPLMGQALLFAAIPRTVDQGTTTIFLFCSLLYHLPGPCGHVNLWPWVPD